MKLHLLGLAALLPLAATAATTQDDGSAIQVAPKASETAIDPALAPAAAFQDAFQAIAERVAPSITTVAGYSRPTGETPVEADAVEAGTKAAWVRQVENRYPGFELVGSGSGVMISKEGHLLTNRHFLLKPDGTPCDLVDVETVDNRHTIARIVGMEPTLNLAILKLEVYAEGNPPKFEPIVFGNSIDLYPGHWCLAQGDPFGPEKFFSFGLFAGTPSRECYQEQLSATYLQAALQVHPGTYGGALLNLKGEFVGMLTPRSTEITGDFQLGYGVEFALPSNIVRAIYPTILRNESFRSPWLGFAVMSPGELIKELGVEAYGKLDRPRAGIYLENVFEPSPAHAAGLQPGDFLTRFGDAYIGSPLDFQRALYMAGIGAEVELEFYRAGKTMRKTLKIEERPENAITR